MGRYDAGRINQGFSQGVVKADEERELNIRPGAQRHALATDRSEKVSGLFVSSKNKPDTFFSLRSMHSLDAICSEVTSVRRFTYPLI